MRGIEADRGQQGAHFALEVVGDPRTLGGRAVGTPEQPHAAFGECGQQLLVQDPVLIVDQPARDGGNRFQRGAHLVQRHADDRDTCAQLLLQTRDADLEEFIQVAADDAQEAQPLE